MKKLSLLMITILLTFFIGCSTGSSSGSNEVFIPSVELNNIQITKNENGEITKVIGDISLKENNSYFSNVQFSDLNLSLNGCSVSDFNITPTTLNNLDTATFEVSLNSGCTSSDLVISGIEKAQYIDTNIMTKEDSFSIIKTISAIDINNDVVQPISKIIVLPTYIKVTENNQKEELTIITLNSDNRGVSATVEINRLIDDNYNEYGTLDSYEITTNENGEAVVEYTAPSDISAIDGNFSIIFKVKDSSIEFNTTLDFSKENDTNATDYVLELVAPNSFTVDSENSFTVKIVKKTDSSSYINDSDVNDVNVSSINNLITFNEDKNETVYEYNKSSSESIDIYSNTHSGIEFIEVNASIFNGEENITINQLFKVVVLSGPIHALSINYLNTSYDADNGLFVENYAVHAVDRYSNPANEGSKIYFAAINGVKESQKNDGSIGYNGSSEKTEFNTTSGDFNANDVESGDVLAILASENRMDGSYLGGWSVDEVVDSDTLNLFEKYIGDSINQLSFVVGNEKRYDSCSESIKLIDFSSTDGTYEVNSEGIAYITAKYDPYLVGKTVTFFANSNSNERVGIAIKRILKGTGISSSDTLSCQADENQDTNCSLTFYLNNKGNDEALQNTLLRGTFIANDEEGSCSIISESNVTDCNGQYTVTVETEKNTTCNVYWGNAVDYEY